VDFSSLFRFSFFLLRFEHPIHRVKRRCNHLWSHYDVYVLRQHGVLREVKRWRFYRVIRIIFPEKISCKSIRKFLRKVSNGRTDRQTDRQTDKQRRLHNLLGGGGNQQNFSRCPGRLPLLFTTCCYPASICRRVFDAEQFVHDPVNLHCRFAYTPLATADCTVCLVVYGSKAQNTVAIHWVPRFVIQSATIRATFSRLVQILANHKHRFTARWYCEQIIGKRKSIILDFRHQLTLSCVFFYPCDLRSQFYCCSRPRMCGFEFQRIWSCRLLWMRLWSDSSSGRCVA